LFKIQRLNAKYNSPNIPASLNAPTKLLASSVLGMTVSSQVLNFRVYLKKAGSFL
jgi:hypothetical protein